MLIISFDDKDTIFCGVHNEKKCEKVEEFSTLQGNSRAMGNISNVFMLKRWRWKVREIIGYQYGTFWKK